MAGSWSHMTTAQGRLRSNGSFVGMIENLGDAYEAAEDCFGMVQVLAARLAELDGTRTRAEWVRWAAEPENISRGVRLGGRQR
jgi:hypothetical protein